MGVPRLPLFCTSTLTKDNICLQEVRPWPSQREMATVSGGPSFSRTQALTLMNPLPVPRAPDGGGKSECTCCIPLHITLLLWKIVCYFGTPWQPEWIAQGPKLVYLVSEAKPNERHLAQHLKNGKKLRESKNNQGLGENSAETSGPCGLSRASCNSLWLFRAQHLETGGRKGFPEREHTLGWSEVWGAGSCPCPVPSSWTLMGVTGTPTDHPGHSFWGLLGLDWRCGHRQGAFLGPGWVQPVSQHRIPFLSAKPEDGWEWDQETESEGKVVFCCCCCF